MAGSEYEYYLLTDTYEQAHAKGYTDLQRFGYYNEDYHLLQATKGEPIHGKLRNLMTEAGIPVEFSKGEAARRPARGEHPLHRRAGHVRPVGPVQARRQGDRLAERATA